MNKENQKNRILKGVIVSDKMNKTVTVSITRLKKHPKYKKYFRVTKKVLAHDENRQSQIGDLVLIRETRPTSRRKRWIVVQKIASGRRVDTESVIDSAETDNVSGDQASTKEP